MPFDDPACFRLDRIPVRPIHWPWRPYLACDKLALRRGRPACAEGRPSALAVVRSGLAARRRTTPMRVRPTDPCRAPRRPYGLNRRPTVAQASAWASGTSESFDLSAGVAMAATVEETERHLLKRLSCPSQECARTA